MSVSTGETAGSSEAEHPVLYYLRVAVYGLGLLLGLSLLVVGTIALIAEIKGTWHWMIHLESTISYMSMFVVGVMAVLVPLFGAMLVGRWWVHE